MLEGAHRVHRVLIHFNGVQNHGAAIGQSQRNERSRIELVKDRAVVLRGHLFAVYHHNLISALEAGLAGGGIGISKAHDGFYLGSLGVHIIGPEIQSEGFSAAGDGRFEGGIIAVQLGPFIGLIAAGIHLLDGVSRVLPAANL